MATDSSNKEAIHESKPLYIPSSSNAPATQQALDIATDSTKVAVHLNE